MTAKTQRSPSPGDFCIKIRDRGDRAARTLENLRPYRSRIGEGDNGPSPPWGLESFLDRCAADSPPFPGKRISPAISAPRRRGRVNLSYGPGPGH